MPLRCLVDTNVLLRLANPSMEQHPICKQAVARLHATGWQLYYTLQNAAEFWNVSTRPVERNGHGLTALETMLGWREVEEILTLLPDDARVYANWRKLVVSCEVRGVQVHDAKLAATMLAHDVSRILTFNTADFVRFPGIEAIDPSAI